jgi:hypothetical protein
MDLYESCLKLYVRTCITIGKPVCIADEKIDPELHKAMKDTETMYANHMRFKIHNKTTFKEKYPEMAKEVFKEES